MRWDNLKVDEDERARLPGYRDEAVVRRFDAPEALDTRFYEIRAKSALNRVPEVSQVPFRWTVNPYRGCSHACTYCVSGDTRVLLPSGRTRAIGDLDVGDEILGTERIGGHRRLVRTVVLDHWSSIKPAFRITLADGTELVASADHRFLTPRGWTFVAGPQRRPHLTPGSRMIGVRGGVDGRPAESYEHRRGQLRGRIRGDGHPSEDRRKGFPVGVFDAAGSCGTEVIRIVNADPVVLGWGDACLPHLGFDTVVERTSEVRGGLGERLRFVRSMDSERTHTNQLVGRALETSADLRVVSIEPLPGAQRLYDITTGTGDFIANGVVSHNCFARPTHRYLDFGAGRDFEREIVVKVNVPEVLRAELGRSSWRGEHVALGTNTDPYQWVEGRYRLMPGIWEAMRDFANPCSILTKSPLVLRDLPLLREIAERTTVSANLSVPTLDEKAWRASEPHTPHPRARLEAVGELNRAGIPCGVLVAPLMPGINDAPEQVERILELAAEAGATGVSGIALHLRGEVRGIFLDWLRSYRPDLLEHYRRLYARGAYAPRKERERLAALVRSGPVASLPSASRDHRGVRRTAADAPGRRPATPERPPPQQQSLF